MKRRRPRRQRSIVVPLSSADRRSAWIKYLGGVAMPEVQDVGRLVDLSAGWHEPEIATSVGLAVAFRLLGNPASDQAVIEQLILRDNHIEEPDPVAKSILRHAAIHEAGHAVWAAHSWGSDSVTAVALLGPPPSLGQTLVAEAAVSGQMDRRQRRRLVGMAFAGAIAEHVVFGPDHPAIGVEYDIEQARWELSQRGVPRSDRGEAGFAARWSEVQALLEANRQTVIELAHRLLEEPSRLLMGTDLQLILSVDPDSDSAAA